MYFKKIFVILLISFIFNSCSNNPGVKNNLERRMNNIATNYVKLVLKIGKIDPGYIDAYFGPKNLEVPDTEVIRNDPHTIKLFNAETDNLLNGLDSLSNYKADKLESLRYRFLYKQLLAVKAKLFMISGGRFSFDEESKNLYDAVSPNFKKEHFQAIINKLDKILPGHGNINKRLENFKKKFIIPKDKIDTVFMTAINECRKITLQHIALPGDEHFKVEFVDHKPWSGYNWYKGNSFSVIQVNTDLPIYIDRAIGLAAHEGYPGHHVYNILMEKNLVKQRGWIEFSVYPLFSPQSLIAEGTADFGITLLFPGNSRTIFAKDVLFPLAGLDSSKAEQYYKVLALTKQLNYASNIAAKNYLDGKWNKLQTINWLEKYNLMTDERANQRLRFIEKYRSYIINYNVGFDLIKNYIYLKAGTAQQPEERWKIFEYLLSTPQTPSGLRNYKN